MKEVKVTIDFHKTTHFMADNDWDEDRCIQFIIDNYRQYFSIAEVMRHSEVEETGYTE